MRLGYLDAMRGRAIVLVVMGHLMIRLGYLDMRIYYGLWL